MTLRAVNGTALENLSADELKEGRPPQFSEEDLALKFSKLHGDRWRYVAAWGLWLWWTGTHWAEERTLKTVDLARDLCRRQAMYSKASPKRAVAIASKSTVMAVESLARADRAHAASADEWDVDSWLLNTPAGAIDLHTGQLRANSPDDRCTKITSVAPGGTCDTWLRFLDRVTGRNDSLISYLQRVAGCALTGDTSDHALVFLFGAGAKGKSTIGNVLTGILHTYAAHAPAETFTETQQDRHPADLAMLRGARLVTAIETEDGRRWATARIKSLTGGDPIAARFMRQDFFTFTPQFKLLIAGNHKPGLKNVDEAIRRRMHLIPFTVTIPPEERDAQLPEKLRAEWPGILAWMIEGCLEWQRIGLQRPATVSSATDDYLRDEDVIGLWLADGTESDHGALTSTAELHRSYQVWANKSGEKFLGVKRFSQALESRGLQRDRNASVRGFRGIRLVRPNDLVDNMDRQ